MIANIIAHLAKLLLPYILKAIENEQEKTEKKKAERRQFDMVRNLEEFVAKNYDCRFNTVYGQAEIRTKDGKGKYLPADRRTLNSIVLDAKAAGIDCWDRDVARLLCSDRIVDYNPLRGYMENLPEWDGCDRVTELSARVSNDALWQRGFHAWMLAMAASWTGRKSAFGNQLVPLLVSREQGLGKSTFCRRLLPAELSEFFTDRFDLRAESRCEAKMAFYGLVNLDEFDRYGSRQSANLKNLIQMSSVSVRLPYTGRFTEMNRTASFIATSNSFELLSDPTGSRRYLCVEITKPIDNARDIDHAQLYAQLLHELEAGEILPYLTREEEKEVQRRNKRFMRTDPIAEVFTKAYTASDETEYPLSATEIFMSLKKKYPAAMRGTTPRMLTRTLSSLGMVKRHTRNGNVYMVARVE